MLHFRAVFLADGAAAFARLPAGAKLRARQFEVGAGETRDDPRCRQADIGAIVAFANASHHLGHIFLAEAGISAGIARFRAGVAGGNALDIYRVIRRWIHRVGFEHLFDVTHESLRFYNRGCAGATPQDLKIKTLCGLLH